MLKRLEEGVILKLDKEIPLVMLIEMSTEALTVSRLVRRMKNVLEIEVGEVWVEGEISNLRKQASGHQYFSLKDANAQISAVFFKGSAARSKVNLEDGKKLKIFGEVSIYEARGTMQLIVRKVEEIGQGDLQARFEQLKKALHGEGLFDQDRKKPLPPFPHRIGVVTSPTGAALQDMLNVLSRRAPWVEVFLYPCRVQGKGAEKEIVAGIKRFGSAALKGEPAVDVVIIGRGGGSLEDLWNFNEEEVARAISECPTPLVSAVGHEIDFTISDFVADERAPTPSAAAELVVPDREELLVKVEAKRLRLERHVKSVFSNYSQQLKRLHEGALSRSSERVLKEPQMRLAELEQALNTAFHSHTQRKSQAFMQAQLRLRSKHPQHFVERRAQILSVLKSSLQQSMAVRLEKHTSTLARLASLRSALGPDSAFERGFSIAYDEEGKIIRSAKQAREEKKLTTRFHDGVVESEVTPTSD